jgi:hypothetical protein
VLEGLIDRKNDYALIISFDSVNSSAVIESYTPLSSLHSSTLSCAYLSACDRPGLSTTCNNIDSFGSTFDVFTSIKNSLNKTQKHLSHSANIFLSSKKKYKPVAKKVRPVIGELPKKFRIKRKIIGDPLDTIPTLNPNPHPSNQQINILSSDVIESTKITLETFYGQPKETSCTISSNHTTLVSLGAKTRKVVFGLTSFRQSTSQLFLILHGWSETFQSHLASTKKYVQLFKRRLQQASASLQTPPIDLNGFAFSRKTEKLSGLSIASNLSIKLLFSTLAFPLSQNILLNNLVAALAEECWISM